MKHSFYNFIFDYRGKKYVYNSITGAFAEVSDAFVNHYLKVGEDENYKAVGDSTFDEMVKSKVLVPNDCNELELLAEEFKTGKRENGFAFTIAPTLSCVFSCPYCYETKTPKFMTDEHVLRCIELIKSLIVDKKYCSITWYGGEPLLARDIVCRISKEIMSFCDENKIQYFANMITNGYLLTNDDIENFKKFNIRNVQVTLDGCKNDHNKKRYVNSSKGKVGSYNIIIGNIKKLDEADIKVSIRINVDADNQIGFHDLFEDLKTLDLKNTSVYFGLLTPYTEACASIASSCITNEEFSTKTLSWNKLLYESGLLKSMLNVYPKRIIVPCVALNENSYAIDPNGFLYKCWNDIGIQGKAVGHLDNIQHKLIHKNANSIIYTEWTPFSYDCCRACKVLPLCSGLCAYMALRDGTPKCSAWKYILEDYLKQLVEERKGGEIS